MISVFYQTCMLSLMVNSRVRVPRIIARLNSEPQYLVDPRTAVAETNAEKIS
jgi:hypothetical protein